MMKICSKCGRVLDEKTQFYHTNRFRQGLDMNICKSCINDMIDEEDYSTFDFVLRQLDVPFIKDSYERILKRHGKNHNILGRYLALMNLGNLAPLVYADGARINHRDEEEKGRYGL